MTSVRSIVNPLRCVLPACLARRGRDMIAIMQKSFFDLLMRIPHHTRVIAAGELVFERDDQVTSYFAVQSGEVHLLRRQEDGLGVILQRARAGSVLAEASLLTRAYHCSAVGVTAARLSVFARSEVQRMLETDPSVALAFTRHLTVEVQAARRRAEILALRKVADRLEAWLVWHDGVLPEKGAWNRVADEIGVSTEALYRELARRRSHPSP